MENWLVYECTGVLVHRCFSDASVHWCIGLLVHWCLSALLSWFIGIVLVHWCIGVVVYWYVSALVFWCSLYCWIGVVFRRKMGHSEAACPRK